MTARTIKLIVFIALLIHGIGHFQGVVAALGVKINSNSGGFSSGMLGGAVNPAARILGLVLFSLTAISGILAALSFWNLILPLSYWQTLAVFSAIGSTLCLLIFPSGFALFFNKVGAVAVNLFIYYSIVFQQHWPAGLFED